MFLDQPKMDISKQKNIHYFFAQLHAFVPVLQASTSELYSLFTRILSVLIM